MSQGSTRSWLLYGANGYTGTLIAREAAKRGIRPTLAGRSREKIAALGRELECPTAAFGLDDVSETAEHLRGYKLVLNCAGPFSRTARPMIEACLEAGSHYLDITGEIDVIEMAHDFDQRAKAAGVALLPAVGFDVVPTDCLAKMLADELPSANELILGFHGIGGMSPGTAKTMVEGLTKGVRMRRDGKIVPGATTPDPVRGIPIPWGDVASAFYSTGIPSIATYMIPPPKEAAMLRWSWLVRILAQIGPVRAWLNRQIERNVKGPDERELREGRTTVWGEVRNAVGELRSGKLDTPGGYQLTVLTALAAIDRVLEGRVSAGFATPSLAFGKDFILSIPGVRRVQ